MVGSCYLCGNKVNKDEDISLHKFPCYLTENVIHMKWVNACRLNLDHETSNLMICSVHFEDADFSSRKLRPRLKPDAVPSVCLPQPLSKVGGVDKESGSSIGNECHDLANENHEASNDDVESPCFLEAPRICSEEITDLVEKSPARADTCETPIRADEPTTPRSPVFSMPRFVSEIVTPNVTRSAKAPHRTKSMEVKRLQLTIRRLSCKVVNLRKRVQELEGRTVCQLEFNIPGSDGSQLNMSDGDGLYDLEMAKSDLSNLNRASGMPFNWVLAINTNGVNLLYVGDSMAAVPVSRSIFVQPNMTLKIRIMGNFTKSLNFGRMTCINDMVTAMESVAKLTKCSGIDGVCHGEGFISETLGESADKCLSCRHERKRRTDRQNYERKRSIANKKLRKAEDLKNLKRKFARLQKDMDQAQKTIGNLRKQCAMASETAVSYAIRYLEKSHRRHFRLFC